MPLQTTYRPRSFKAFMGNEEVSKAVKLALDSDDPNHCILITGPSGCGKTTLVRIIARYLGAYDPDSKSNPGFIEINAADNRGVDTIRAIREECSRIPLGSDVRLFFFDECHQQTRAAQEMFLKLLEEASGYNWFVFATTNPEMLTDTFKRRCAHYKLTPLSENEITALLSKVCKKEGITPPDDLLAQISANSVGSPGIALGILDAVKGLPENEMQAAVLKQAEKESQVIELCRLLAKQGTTWKQVQPILKSLKEQGEDAEGIRRMILGYCASWLLNKDEPRAWVIMDTFREPMYNIGFPGVVLACYDIVSNV